jgi:hypothetical protein
MIDSSAPFPSITKAPLKPKLSIPLKQPRNLKNLTCW